MHFLLISENEFTNEIKCNGMTTFVDFMSDSGRRRGERESVSPCCLADMHWDGSAATWKVHFSTPCNNVASLIALFEFAQAK